LANRWPASTSLSFSKAVAEFVMSASHSASRNAKPTGQGLLTWLPALAIHHSDLLQSLPLVINKLLTGLFVADCVPVLPFKGVPEVLLFHLIICDRH
jgi:hypothetical protein